MFRINAIKPNDILYIDKMLDEAFGADRFDKTAYRLRDGVSAVQDLSFIVRSGDSVKASLQFWPILIKDGERALEAILLGPIAVARDYRGQGIGLKLMTHGLEKAKEFGHQRVILVGDESYYQKVGFSRNLALGLAMPGPVDKDRLLAQELVPGAMKDVKGMISKIK